MLKKVFAEINAFLDPAVCNIILAIQPHKHICSFKQNIFLNVFCSQQHVVWWKSWIASQGPIAGKNTLLQTTLPLRAFHNISKAFFNRMRVNLVDWEVLKRRKRQQGFWLLITGLKETLVYHHRFFFKEKRKNHGELGRNSKIEEWAAFIEKYWKNCSQKDDSQP